MSGIEIERKFLVKKGGSHRDAAFSVSHIQQGYIPAEGATVRIRLRDDKAYLTIKGKSRDNGLSRYEFEKEISAVEAVELLKLCRGGVIDKHRYLVRCGERVFEVDEFHGANEGLVIAEVELPSPDADYAAPDFLGPEVTADKHFRNAFMSVHPYSEWREIVPEEYR
jgi:adenylate cyclase